MNRATPSLPLWEKAFTVAVLFFSTAAVLPLMASVHGHPLDPVRGDPTSERLWVLVYAVTLFLLVRRHTDVLWVLARNRALFALVALAIASTAWSGDPALTLRRSVALVLTTLFGVYVATSFPRDQLAGLVAWTLAGVTVLSLVLAVVKPAYGLDYLRGSAWRGAFTTKNELGRIAALTLAVWLLRVLTLRGHLYVSLCVTGIAGLVLVRTSSRSALCVALLITSLIVLLPALRAHVSIAVPAGAVLIAGTVIATNWLVHHADAVLASFGSTPTLTGRSKIWSAVWDMAQIHPLRGYGYDAFWRGLSGPSAYVWNTVGSTPPHAHNGFLDLWLALGLVGVVLFGASLSVNLARAVVEARRAWSFDAIFPFTALVFLVLFNISESTLLTRNSLFWILYVATAVQLGSVRPHLVTAADANLAETAASPGLVPDLPLARSL
jgi:exopolysaccharide production protein ExoQ